MDDHRLAERMSGMRRILRLLGCMRPYGSCIRLLSFVFVENNVGGALASFHTSTTHQTDPQQRVERSGVRPILLVFNINARRRARSTAFSFRIISTTSGQSSRWRWLVHTILEIVVTMPERC